MENRTPEYSFMRKHDLLVRTVGEEVIIYDGKTQKAHCLNGITASVWKRWEAGNSVHDICLALDQPDEEIVCTILSELYGSGLLSNPIPASVHQNVLSRRDLIKKIGIGMTVPFVTSVIVPPPTAAASPPRPQRRLRRTS